MDPMTETVRADLRSEVELWEAFRFAGDGYDRAEVAERVGWRPIAAWGKDGWDLGSWPYVMIFFRERNGRFEVCTNTEGDASLASFETEPERSAHVDAIALFHWRNASEPWVEGIRSVADMPADLRGPFSWARCNA